MEAVINVIEHVRFKTEKKALILKDFVHVIGSLLLKDVKFWNEVYSEEFDTVVLSISSSKINIIAQLQYPGYCVKLYRDVNPCPYVRVSTIEEVLDYIRENT